MAISPGDSRPRVQAARRTGPAGGPIAADPESQGEEGRRRGRGCRRPPGPDRGSGTRWPGPPSRTVSPAAGTPGRTDAPSHRLGLIVQANPRRNLRRVAGEVREVVVMQDQELTPEPRRRSGIGRLIGQEAPGDPGGDGIGIGPVDPGEVELFEDDVFPFDEAGAVGGDEYLVPGDGVGDVPGERRGSPGPRRAVNRSSTARQETHAKMPVSDRTGKASSARPSGSGRRSACRRPGSPGRRR